ncbi:hypothetical protein [Mycobacterium sp. AZCC_0083]|uniref:hypothetical protein n=1 Tax=Mycobacterium sp. AZCC_0083 TaxID=2735882 RepID=UPI00161438A7|nr:hypothetical protein [Mycobacterium sp. AZCC_0083]MBB5167218.1 hypothetical protein [Mycobacterium sp. AZCC_0083]
MIATVLAIIYLIGVVLGIVVGVANSAELAMDFGDFILLLMGWIVAAVAWPIILPLYLIYEWLS